MSLQGLKSREPNSRVGELADGIKGGSLIEFGAPMGIKKTPDLKPSRVRLL